MEVINPNLDFSDYAIIAYLLAAVIVFAYAMYNLGGQFHARLLVAFLLGAFCPLTILIGIMLAVEYIAYIFIIDPIKNFINRYK